MELIALNIGYDLGILSQRIFAMLVIMALVTTIMTGPLLALFGKDESGIKDSLRQPPLEQPHLRVSPRCKSPSTEPALYPAAASVILAVLALYRTQTS